MLEIDGSYGEGGGQILRSATALSALTGIPCTIMNIRANRPTPGLKPQHLVGLQAAARICSAETKGIHIGSQKIEFIPHKIRGGDHTLDVGTAGSVTLVLQVLTPICLNAEEKITLTITGGTDVMWSPTIFYFENVFCYFLEKMKAHITVSVEKYGFYPRGGGKVKAVTEPWKDRTPLTITEKGALEKIEAASISSSFLRKAQVSERQSEAFKRVFSTATIQNRYVDTLNPGSSFCAVAHYANSRLGADSLGEKGKPAEKVGEEAASILEKEMEAGCALDTHMGDQIIPYLALAGGKVSISHLSEHAKTNIWVCQQFLDTKLSVTGNMITMIRNDERTFP